MKSIKSFINWLFKTKSKKNPTVELRIAKNEDIPVIVELCLLQAERGHFSDAYLTPMVRPGLVRQIECAVAGAPVPMPGHRNGAGARIFVMEQGGSPIGFAMFLEHKPGSWSEHVELFLVALCDEHKGQGLGKLMVTSLISHVQSKVVYARCFKNSIHMNNHLLTLGFKQVSVSKIGTATLELTR